jgi:inositol transporter-like SP family MFS transporter
MASYIDSASIVGVGTTLVIYQSALGLGEGEIGVLSAALTLSIAGGALFGGRLGDRFGRKSVFSITMGIIAVGAALLIIGSSFPILLVAVMLLGIGTGADLPVSLATIAEASAGSKPGKFVSFSNVLWLIGIVTTQLIGIAVGDLGRVGGQILVAHVGIVAVVVLVLRTLIPESAQWRQTVALHGNTDRRQTRRGFSTLISSGYAIPLLGLLGFYSLTNLAANTQGQFGTYIWVNVVDQSVSFASAMSLVSQVTWFLWAFVFMALADNHRLRMRWFAISAIVGVLGQLLPVFVGFSVTTMLISQLAFGVFVGFAFEGIMKVWTQESFPASARATAQGTVIALARVVAALLASVTPIMLGTSPVLMYGLLSAVLAIGLTIGYVTFRHPRHNHLAEEASPLDAVAR